MKVSGQTHLERSLRIGNMKVLTIDGPCYPENIRAASQCDIAI